MAYSRSWEDRFPVGGKEENLERLRKILQEDREDS